jgi:hypothetical protein
VARLTLAICVIIPAAGLAYNLADQPPSYGYESELVLLILVAVCALWLTRRTVNAAVFLYCTWSLAPVFSMLQYHASIGGQGAWLMGTPLVGLLMVGALTGCSWATVGYIPLAIISSLVAGMIYGNEGASGVLAGGALVIGVIALVLCRKKKVADLLGSATEKIESIQRGLDNLEERYGR